VRIVEFPEFDGTSKEEADASIPALRPVPARAVGSDTKEDPAAGSVGGIRPPDMTEEEAPAAGPSHPLQRRVGVSPKERVLLTRALTEEGEKTAALERERQWLWRLLEISRELTSILDPDRLLEAVLDGAIVLTNAERGLLLLEEVGCLKVVQARGAARAVLSPEASAISETLARACLRENRVIPVESMAALPELRDARSIRALDTQAAVCVPLREHGVPRGVLYLDSVAPGLRSTRQEIPFLEAFASQAAVCLMNARELRRLEESHRLLAREVETLRAEAQSDAGFARILGRSPAMVLLFERIRLLKDTDIPVLLLGESGTGKELVARALHTEGRRRARPFVPVNCAGFPAELLDSLVFGHRRGAFTGAAQDSPGLVEQAEGGTFFLDEVGDMPAQLQVKLLRFLESGEFRRVGETEIRRADVRLISATNADIRTMVKNRTFREDLYFRLAGIHLELPPLRDRREDLPLLVDHFLEEAIRRSPRSITGITDRARTMLLRYPWPGNVRQLRHVIEGACALVPDGNPVDEGQLRLQLAGLSPEHSPAHVSGTLQEASSQFEREMLESVLRRNEWNITRAAKDLGISRQHLHSRIRIHGLRRSSDRPS
jgi:Nif-specific regulatory protein